MKLKFFFLLMLLPALTTTCNKPPAEVDLFAAMVEGFYPEDQPGVSILVAREGEILFQQAYGLANLEWKISSTTGTVYQIDSITKMFTATAILKLAEDNLLMLEDPLSDYYPGLVPNAEAITIRQLLTHTSGVINQAKLGGKWLPYIREDFSLNQILAM